MSLPLRIAALLALAASLLAVPAAASASGPNLGFGAYGEAAGQLKGPGDADVAPDGSVYVSDFSNRRIDVFSADGIFEFAFGKEVAANGSGAGVCTAATGCKQGAGDGSAGALGSPEGVAIDPAGRVYVSNLGANRIDVFNLAGQYLFGFGKGVNAGPGNPDLCTLASGCKEAAPSAAAGALNENKGIGLGPDGSVYVADRRNNRVDVFSHDGAFAFAFGGAVNESNGSNVCTAATGCKIGSAGAAAGEIREPFDVKAGPGGSVLVADPLNSRVEVYTAQGAFQRAFGKGVAPAGGDVCASACQGGAAAGAGAIRPSSLEVSAAGTVFLVDPINNRLSQLTVGGQFQQAFGEGVLDGSEAFQVCSPASACLAGKAKGSAPGAITGSLGLALGCHGLYTVEHFAEGAAGFSRIERFGAPDVALPACPSAAKPPVPPVAKPSNRFKFGKLRLNLEKGTATLLVRVPGPGVLSLKGRGLRARKAGVKKAGVVKLSISPTGKARRLVRTVGKAKVKAIVSFRPTGGDPLTKKRPLTLKAALGR